MPSTLPINEYPLDITRILRPIPRASFSLLDDRPVLFSEASQKINELNQVAAYIWCCLLDNKPAEAICDDLTKFGFEPVAGRDHLSQAIQGWFKLGLLGAEWELNRTHSFSARVGRLAFNIHPASKRLAQLLIPLFSEVGNVIEDIEDSLDVVEMDGSDHIFHNNAFVGRCTTNELAPALKAYLTDQVVLRSSPDISFHGACLLSGAKGLLVSGRPGACKSTLALHLIDAGFEYVADDVVLIAPDGRASGVLFAPTLKPGAWSMGEKFRPDLGNSAVNKRPDGKRVRYLKSPRTAYSGSVPIGWIVFIKRAPNVPVTFTLLRQLDTISRLIDASYSPTAKLTDQAFGSIK